MLKKRERAGGHLEKDTRGGWQVEILARNSRRLNLFSWRVKLNLGFGYYACHGALTVIQSKQFAKFYNVAPSLTSKDDGHSGERPAGALSS